MDPTVVTMIGVGVSLAIIVLNGQRSLRTEIGAVETRLRGEINAVEGRLGKRIDDTKSELRLEISAVETRLGKRIDRLEDRVDALVGSRRLLPPAATPDESPA